MRCASAKAALTFVAGLVLAEFAASTLPAADNSLAETSTLSALEDGRYSDAERGAEGGFSELNASPNIDPSQIIPAVNRLLEAKIANGRAAEPETLVIADRL